MRTLPELSATGGQRTLPADCKGYKTKTQRMTKLYYFVIDSNSIVCYHNGVDKTTASPKLKRMEQTKMKIYKLTIRHTDCTASDFNIYVEAFSPASAVSAFHNDFSTDGLEVVNIAW